MHAAAAERMIAAVYTDAQRSTASCAPLSDRMDAYKLAAESGHTAGHVTYAHLLLTGRESWTDTLQCSTDTSLAAAATAAYRLTPKRLTEAVTHLHAAVAAGSSTAAYRLALLLLSGLAPAPFDTAITASGRVNSASRSADVTSDVIGDAASTVCSSTAAGGTGADQQCDSSAGNSHSCSSSSSSSCDDTDESAAATISSTDIANARHSR
eukprot:15890-Heterococcus_DN1.PRE.6